MNINFRDLKNFVALKTMIWLNLSLIRLFHENFAIVLQVVFEDELDSIIRGIARDPITGTIYVFSDYSVHKYNLDHEDKHIWKVFLEKGNFEKCK